MDTPEAPQCKDFFDGSLTDPAIQTLGKGWRFGRRRWGTVFKPSSQTRRLAFLEGWSWSQIIGNSRDGDWWLATGPGLPHYRKLQTAPSLLGPEAGPRRANIFRVFEDSRGFIWASVPEISNSGLYRRNPETGRFENFDKSYGFPPLRD
jgi:hypothetical protein